MASTRTVGARAHRAQPALRQEDGEYVVDVDPAGFRESELVIEILGRHLTVRGERAADDDTALSLPVRVEESFALREDADIDRTRASFSHGTLTIHVPRMRLEPRRLRIEHPSYHVNSNAEPC